MDGTRWHSVRSWVRAALRLPHLSAKLKSWKLIQGYKIPHDSFYVAHFYDGTWWNEENRNFQPLFFFFLHIIIALPLSLLHHVCGINSVWRDLAYLSRHCPGRAQNMLCRKLRQDDAIFRCHDEIAAENRMEWQKLWPKALMLSILLENKREKSLRGKSKKFQFKKSSRKSSQCLC